MFYYFLFSISDNILHSTYVCYDFMKGLWFYLIFNTMMFLFFDSLMRLGAAGFMMLWLLISYWVFGFSLLNASSHITYSIDLFLCLMFLMNLKLSYTILNNYNMSNDLLLSLGYLEVLLNFIKYVSDLFMLYCFLEVITLTVVIPMVSNVWEEGSYSMAMDYFVMNLIVSLFIWLGLLGIYTAISSLDYNVLLLNFYSAFYFNNSMELYFLFMFLMIFVKLGIFPFHSWSLRLYSNLNSLSFLLLLGPIKITYWVVFLLILKLLNGFDFMLIWEFNMIFGTVAYFGGLLGTLSQLKVKDFLIYSSSVYSGMFMISLSISDDVFMFYILLWYLVFYLVVSFLLALYLLKWGNFSATLNDCFDSLWQYDFWVVLILICLFMGLPPFFSFFIKYVFLGLLLLNSTGSLILMWVFNIFFWCSLMMYMYYFWNLYLINMK